MSYIKFNSIEKKYNFGTTSEVHALRGINLEIERGETLAILGKSGSGKSTLLHILGCLDNATSGSYSLDGKQIEKLSDRELAFIRNRNIGFVLQDFGLIMNRTVVENVSIPLLFGNTKFMQIKKQCLEVLGQLGIEELYKRKVSQLSGGQKQRVAIARSLVNNPDIILADEPTGSLDSKTADDVMNILMGLNKNNKTIIIVTHDVNIASLCRRQIYITDGVIGA